MSNIDTLHEIRKEIFLTACSGGLGHLASSFSSVELLYALYILKALKVDPANPDWTDRDRFVLSKGHGALAYYVMLAHAGFFPMSMLEGYCRPGSVMGGEPSGQDIPGVEAPSGSLGHGLSYGVGTALGAKLSHSPSRSIVLLGDGECEEGSVWEAVMSGAALHLGNLIALIDYNGIQKMDTVEAVEGIASWEKQWRSFGWEIATVDGHDVEALYQVLSDSRTNADKPLAVLAKTVKGKGLSLMENNPAWHYRMPNKKETKVFMAELNISQEELDHAKSLYQRT